MWSCLHVINLPKSSRGSTDRIVLKHVMVHFIIQGNICDRQWMINAEAAGRVALNTLELTLMAPSRRIWTCWFLREVEWMPFETGFSCSHEETSLAKFENTMPVRGRHMRTDHMAVQSLHNSGKNTIKLRTCIYQTNWCSSDNCTSEEKATAGTRLQGRMRNRFVRLHELWSCVHDKYQSSNISNGVGWRIYKTMSSIENSDAKACRTINTYEHSSAKNKRSWLHSESKWIGSTVHKPSLPSTSASERLQPTKMHR